MYVCEVCDRVVGPRVPMRKHILYRTRLRLSVADPRGQDGGRVIGTRTEVLREIPVCVDCHRRLERGEPLHALLAERRAPPPVLDPVPAPVLVGPEPPPQPVLRDAPTTTDGEGLADLIRPRVRPDTKPGPKRRPAPPARKPNTVSKPRSAGDKKQQRSRSAERDEDRSRKPGSGP